MQQGARYCKQKGIAHSDDSTAKTLKQCNRYRLARAWLTLRSWLKLRSDMDAKGDGLATGPGAAGALPALASDSEPERVGPWVDVGPADSGEAADWLRAAPARAQAWAGGGAPGADINDSLHEGKAPYE